MMHAAYLAMRKLGAHHYYRCHQMSGQFIISYHVLVGQLGWFQECRQSIWIQAKI
jgi:hypothetical protein